MEAKESKESKKVKIRPANPDAEKIQLWAEEHGFETCFDRADKMKACPIGHEGACCKNCSMGPCRLVGKEDVKGICGATKDTVAARNLVRMVAAGTSAHSDHGLDMAMLLLAVAEGHTKDFEIKDTRKLYKVAGILDVEFEGRPVNDVAKDVAHKFIEDFTRQQGEVHYAKRAPKKTLERWRKWGIVPRGVQREVIEAMHRTNTGVDLEPDSLMRTALRTALADGWAGSMIATDITDILYGTPHPIRGKASFGVFEEDMVNVVVHGHEPNLAEKFVEVASDPEIVSYAKSKGAKGVNLTGMCCTANEILVRHGISTMGGFTNQELAILTGMVDAMTVDVQCIMPDIADLSKKFHTKVITTSPKAYMPGAIAMPMVDDSKAKQLAKDILKVAIDNFPNRTKEGIRPTGMGSYDMVTGFSHEYIEYMLGGKWRHSFRPLNDAIMSGRIRGVAGVVGCDNTRFPATINHKYLITELIKRDVLVVTTGCGSHACGLAGYLTPEMALETAGPGLRQVCEATGMPPILALGSCVDNSRIMTIAAQMASEGGLSDEIGGMPAVGIAPEWMSEKAVAIACYCAASGVPVIFGGDNIFSASKEVTDHMTNVWMERFRGCFVFEKDVEKILEMTLNFIDKARDELKLRKYEPGKFGTEKVLMDMAARREIHKAGAPHIGF
jgi:carbon-monoxide dehydrogenase catalytic subunit